MYHQNTATVSPPLSSVLLNRDTSALEGVPYHEWLGDKHAADHGEGQQVQPPHTLSRDKPVQERMQSVPLWEQATMVTAT